MIGSSSSLCDLISGQCLCRPLYTDRDCSKCIEGYGNVTAGCRECDCGIGAAEEDCDAVTGLCKCQTGVIGDRCDQCDHDHYGLSMNGCLGESFKFILIKTRIFSLIKKLTINN